MLSILTAAETEMYENSKQKEENRDNSERTAQLVQERDDFMNQNDALKEMVQRQENENALIKQELQSEKSKLEIL